MGAAEPGAQAQIPASLWLGCDTRPLIQGHWSPSVTTSLLCTSSSPASQCKAHSPARRHPLAPEESQTLHQAGGRARHSQEEPWGCEAGQPGAQPGLGLGSAAGETEARGPAARDHEQALPTSHPPMLLRSPPDRRLTPSHPRARFRNSPCGGWGVDRGGSFRSHPSRHTLAAGEPGTKRLIWVRFNTQVKQPCAPRPAARAQPAPPQPLRSPRGSWQVKRDGTPQPSHSGPKELHPLQRQRSTVAGGQALEAPEVSVIVCCFLATRGWRRDLAPTEGRV